MKLLVVDSQWHSNEALQRHLLVEQRSILRVFFLPMLLVQVLGALVALADNVAVVLMELVADRTLIPVKYTLGHIHSDNIYCHHDNRHHCSIQDRTACYCSMLDNLLVY